MASYQFLITFEFVHSSFHFRWYFQPALRAWHLSPGPGTATGSSVVLCSDPVPSLTWEGYSLKHREDSMISLLNPRIPSVAQHMVPARLLHLTLYHSLSHSLDPAAVTAHYFLKTPNSSHGPCLCYSSMESGLPQGWHCFSVGAASMEGPSLATPSYQRTCSCLAPLLAKFLPLGGLNSRH